MALIDLAVRSTLFLNSARASVLAYGTIGACQIRPSQTRLERLIQQTVTTCFASFALKALPLTAFEGTLIGAALPWAPAAFIVAALATAYFAPDKTDKPLQALEITTCALTALAVLAAPSAVTLGTLGVVCAVWIQMHEIPYLSQPIDKVMKATAGALSAIGLLWALKESILSLKIQYALYALLLGAASLYVAHTKAKRAQADLELLEKPELLDEIRREELKAIYKANLQQAFRDIFANDVLKTYRERSGAGGGNTVALMNIVADKWRAKWSPEVGEQLGPTWTLGTPSNQTGHPIQFNSLTEEWVFGTYAHSSDDPRSPMSLLYSTFGTKFSVESLLQRVHQETMHRAITKYLGNRLRATDPSADVTNQEALYAQASVAGSIDQEVLYLCTFAEGITLFAR